MHGSWPPWICGFRPFRQPADLISSVATLLCKAAEWRRPLVLIKTDAFKAFDRLSWRRALESLQRRCPRHRDEAAVILREHAGADISYMLRDRGCSVRPARGRGCMQGQGSSPGIWNCVQCDGLEPWALDCEQAQLGFRLDEGNGFRIWTTV